MLVSKNGTVEDLIQALIKKAKITDEAEGGRIRVYETSSNRFYREPARDQSVLNLNEYTQIFAERIPEEERTAEDNNFIHVFHFQNEVNRVHGVPFKFLLLEVSIHLLARFIVHYVTLMSSILLMPGLGREIRRYEEETREENWNQRQELREDQICYCQTSKLLKTTVS